jgi:predicted  nucleic acid-binding Zn-ribbon protein
MKSHRVWISFTACLVFTLLISSAAKTHAWLPAIEDVLNIKIKPILACNITKNKVAEKITHFEGRVVEHNETYTKLKDRLEAKIGEWEDLGYDVTQLNEDYDETEKKVDDFRDSYDAYAKALENLEGSSCGAISEYTKDLDEVKEAMKNVRQDASEIRSFYQTVIRPHIMDLKDQEI